MKKTQRETKAEKTEKKNGETTPKTPETERLTKEDLATLRTNLKGGGRIPGRCCEYIA